MTPEQQKVYDIQSPQTKRLMDMQAGRPVSDDAILSDEKKFRRVTQDAQCVKEDGSVDLNPRAISTQEHDDYQALRYRRGKWFEEVRTAYLLKAAREGKIHVSLMNQIETNHVMPPDEIREKAEKAYMGLLATIKDKFKTLMDSIFKPKPDYAEIVSEAMKEINK